MYPVSNDIKGLCMAVSKERMKLLFELEEIVANEAYNPNNYGPGGVRQRGRRNYRYPITFIDAEGNKDKRRVITAQAVPPPDIAMTGYYQVGINQLQIMRALDKVVDYLERKHNLKIE